MMALYADLVLCRPILVRSAAAKRPQSYGRSSEAAVARVIYASAMGRRAKGICGLEGYRGWAQGAPGKLAESSSGDTEKRELAASSVLLAKRVKAALANIEVDQVDLATVIEHDHREIALDIRICRVIDEYPWLIADVVVVGPALAGRCAEAGWHQWRRSSDFRWHVQVPPPRLPNVKSGEIVVCAHRVTTPSDAVREMFSLLTKHLSVHDPKRVSLTIASCSAEESLRRREELGILQPKAVIRRTASPRQPSVSSCSGCGQPLSDPVSVAIGMGPERRKRYRPEVVRKAQKYPEVDRRLWVGAIPASEWRAKIRARLKRV
jgi:hypothetical protein